MALCEKNVLLKKDCHDPLLCKLFPFYFLIQSTLFDNSYWHVSITSMKSSGFPTDLNLYCK